MCGVGGHVGRAPNVPLLKRMAATMFKRGPDGSGVWTDGTVGLAATRLAVIDLHERSNQPLHMGRLHLVFNGEIYNYRELRDELRALGRVFETEGDAEVLLHAWDAWGEGTLDRLNGMFAFAIWDEADQSLVAAVDPFGEKPFYYWADEGQLVFASEIKAILLDCGVRAAPDEEAIAAFVARGVFPEPCASFFAGIRRLPAASMLRWRDGRVEVAPYWRPAPVDVPASYPEAVEVVRDLLLDSIRLRLRSDVPVGTSLSGGIDSSLVVMLSAELAGDHRRHAFTARFPGFARDEWGYAEESAAAAGVVEHHAIVPTGDDALRDLDQLVVDQEEPVGSLSVYAQWRVMAAAREAGVVVVLDGQGGDELFGGYDVSPGFALRTAGARATVRELLAAPAGAGAVGRSLAMDFLPRPAKRAYWRRVSTPYASRDVLDRTSSTDSPAAAPWMSGADPLRRELLTQAFVTTLPQLLRYADRSSMAHSRELRLPYLDRRIAEFAFSLPPEFVYECGARKRILRDAGRGAVPETILNRRDKVGFEPPQEAWLEEPAFRERIADALLDRDAATREIANRAALETDVARGRWRDPDGLWRLLNAELWLNLVASRLATDQAA